MAYPSIFSIEIEYVAGSDGLDDASYYPVLLTDQQVNVVGHQTISVDAACDGLGFQILLQMVLDRSHCPDKDAIILRILKDVLTIDAPYHDVVDACCT